MNHNSHVADHIEFRLNKIEAARYLLLILLLSMEACCPSMNALERSNK